ncbi:MAG: hypothetical protein R3B37_01710 [Nitrospira sp.]|nr:hypothetical protein [Nitrospira sp.]
MTRNRVIRSLLAAGWLMGAGSGLARAEAPLIEPPARSETRSESATTLSQVPAVGDREGDIFRQTPTLSGRLQVSEQTLIPYVGAGFGGGYVTDRDRALGPASGFSQQNLLGTSLGQGMMPNEFQMGIRIPF